ncbi:MAG TPA: CBO0543 family protein, partial [Bacillota bacterium]|nr:CBO0543 family protein [Bacillota bacterium]
IWWKLVDKKRAYEIAFYGCMINIAALILDNVGTTLQWWVYPIKLEPLAPPMLTADSILVPVILMFVYQRFSSTWKSFFIANLITGACIAFLAEPLFAWIGYYQLIHWKFIYSFLFYILTSAGARWTILRIVK